MAKSSSATASRWWSTISVSRNSGGGYTVNWRSYGSASAARSAIQSAARSAWGSGWWTITSGWGSGSSGGNYSWWKNTVASSVNQPTITKNINWTNFWFSKNSDGSYNVYANGKYTTVKANSDLGKAAAWYLWNSGTTSSNKSSNTSSTWTGKYTNNSFQNYSNAMSHYISQGMSQDQAHEKAKWFLEDNPNYVSKTSEEKDAEQYGWDTDDTDMNEQTINDVTDNDEYDVKDDPAYQELLWMYNDLNDNYYSLQDTIDRLTSNNTESQVVENKAETSKDPIFDYNTYFKENLSPDKNVWETWQVQAETPTTNTPLTDVTKYQDDAISALENLGFLEPNTEAAESMPDTEEQTTPEEETPETPEQLSEWFDTKMAELENTEGLTPQAIAQTYVDYKNRLAKYIKDNNISDEDAAAMFDSLKNNEKFRNLLNISRR